MVRCLHQGKGFRSAVDFDREGQFDDWRRVGSSCYIEIALLRVLMSPADGRANDALVKLERFQGWASEACVCRMGLSV